MKINTKYFLTLLFVFISMASNAQNDPVLAGVIAANSKASVGLLSAQNAVIGVEVKNRINHNAHLEKIYDLQKEFNDYISTFHEVVVYVAETYGMYQEMDFLIKNIKKLNNDLEEKPDNAFAVALSPKRNKIYVKICKTGGSIIGNLKSALIGVDDKRVKLTEKDRIELVYAVRPKLHELNKELANLRIMIKYTNLSDIWREITHRAYSGKGKKAIAEKCLSDWRSNGKAGL